MYPREITAEFIEQSYNMATEYMQQKVSYIWKLKNVTYQIGQFVRGQSMFQTVTSRSTVPMRTNNT